MLLALYRRSLGERLYYDTFLVLINRQASKYLLDPLNAPQPSDETGPGTHYGSTFAPQPTGGSTTSSTAVPRKTPSTPVTSSGPSTDQKPTPSASTRSSNNPYRNGTRSSDGYPTPPQSASPRKDRVSNISEPFPDFDGSYASKRQSVDQASTQIPTSTGGQASTTTGNNRRRTSSLNQRYPGDQTHRPLDMLMEDNKKANRAPHLQKKHLVGADAIDRLDNLIAPYHHEGPYDATLLARNTSYTNSPVEAVSTTNQEALKATPREMIKDSVEKHRPLDGTAMVPPGMTDRYGNTYNYQEGTDMMIEGDPEGGAYKRWPGVVRCLLTSHTPDLKTLARRIELTNLPRNTSPKTSKAKASPPTPSKKPSKNTKPTPATSPKETTMARMVLKW